jgi:kynurenine formamidase
MFAARARSVDQCAIKITFYQLVAGPPEICSEGEKIIMRLIRLGIFTACSLTLATGLWLAGRANAHPKTATPDKSALTQAEVEGWMTSLSNWGRWGKDDQKGTLNLITPEKSREALKLVRDGVSISMAHTIEKEKYPDNARPFEQKMTIDDGGHAMDLYTIWYHGSTITHIDALCHYSYQGKLFNGYSHDQYITEAGCGRNGIENQKNGYMTRGILVDLPLMKNVDYLEPGTPVTPADIEAWEKFAKVKIGSGDALFVRTGRWVRRAKLGPWNVGTSAAGYDASMLPWLKQRDVALIGNDGVTDVQPSGVEGVKRPIHEIGIAALGLPLVDVMDLEAVAKEAAQRHRWEFLLTFAPVPVPGGTGFPVNPIATF